MQSKMASHRFHTMTLNLMLLFTLVTVLLNNHVSLTSARQLKNSPNEKEANGGGEKEANGGGENGGNHQVLDPSKIPKPRAVELDDQKQFPFPPFPFPFPPTVPGIPGLPMPAPVGGIPFPPPFDIPGVPSLPIPAIPFPPLDIPGVMPSPP